MKTLNRDTINSSNLDIYREKEIIILKINQEKYKKVIYEEEVGSEPELEENVYEEIEEEPEKPKPKKVQQKQKNYIFEYINNDAKRNKQWNFFR